MKQEWASVVVMLYARYLLVGANESDVKYYTNQWLVHVPLGKAVARAVALSNGMEYEGPDAYNDGFHRMTKRDLPPKSSNHNDDVTNHLISHDLVTTASQEAVKARSYRGVVQPRNVYPRHSVPSTSTNENKRESNYEGLFNDEHWDDEWYFQDFRKKLSEPVTDMNIVPVYMELNITGVNVNVTVPDDGLEWTHPDIQPKFNPDISWNYISDNSNIMPEEDANGIVRAHGTRCAGEIIMQPNNTLCGVGVAYNATIGGIKFLDQASTDAREAKVLKHSLRYVCIYSNSWGPADTGTLMEHLSIIVQTSLSKGIHQGRDGKGVIYVFAAGNGKSEGDNCACDGYVNSIYTIAVASCDDSGHVTHYSERCAAIMATAYSGAGLEKNVFTTDVGGQCTTRHTGTSAAAPLVSGVIALALSANPKLTWRDVQHLLAWTSQVAPLSDNFGWNRNKAGFFYSVDFGFGLVNAYKLVQAALKWQNVPEMSSCGIRMPKVGGFPISRNSGARIIVHSDGCEGDDGEIKYMEYVQLVLTLQYSKRGDIQIAMKSPGGTVCHVLENRPDDINPQGLRRWTFSILAFWGESPKGNFTIDIFDKTGAPTNSGVILEMTLSIHGTKVEPKHYLTGPRTYDDFELPKPEDKPRFRSFNQPEGKNTEIIKDDETFSEPEIQSVNNNIINFEESKQVGNVKTMDQSVEHEQNVHNLQSIQNAQNDLMRMEEETINQQKAFLQNAQKMQNVMQRMNSMNPLISDNIFNPLGVIGF